MTRTTRHVGKLAGLWGLGPGSHVCCVVDSSEQLEAWTAKCMAEGALAGQKLLRLISHGHQGNADATVTVIEPPQDMPVAANMLALFRREATVAREEGYVGIRLVADMDWVLTHPEDELAAYELMLDALVAEFAATVVCAYRREQHDNARLAEVLAIHPLVTGAPGTDLGFRIWNIDGGTWEVCGEVDDSNVASFGRALATAMASGPLRRIRCHGLTFISASGIRALVELALTQPDQELVLHGASSVLRRCWQVLGLDSRLPRVVMR